MTWQPDLQVKLHKSFAELSPQQLYWSSEKQSGSLQPPNACQGSLCIIWSVRNAPHSALGSNDMLDHVESEEARQCAYRSVLLHGQTRLELGCRLLPQEAPGFEHGMAWQVEAESMSEADLAKIFRHMLLGVSHTHADVSVQRASA